MPSRTLRPRLTLTDERSAALAQEATACGISEVDLLQRYVDGALDTCARRALVAPAKLYYDGADLPVGATVYAFSETPPSGEDHCVLNGARLRDGGTLRRAGGLWRFEGDEATVRSALLAIHTSAPVEASASAAEEEAASEPAPE